MNIPVFDPNPWDAMTRYLQEWDEWRRNTKHMDTPDGINTMIYAIPLTIALLRNAEETAKLNKSLLWLTGILVALTVIMAYLSIR